MTGSFSETATFGSIPLVSFGGADIFITYGGGTVTSLTSNVSAGGQIIEVASTNGFAINDIIMINPGGANEETNKIIGFGSLHLETPLLYDHQTGEVVLNITVTSINNDIDNNPKEYQLYTNYPNPFNPTTTISYSIPEYSKETIKIFDVLGNQIATLVNKEKSAGTYELNWTAGNLPSGVYFYRLQAGSFVQTKKMVLLKEI